MTTQSSPGWVAGYIPGYTEWNSWWTKKQDATGDGSTITVPYNGVATALSALMSILSSAALPLSQFSAGRNRIHNPSFAINQRAYASGTALPGYAYGHDRWRAGASGCTYNFSQSLVDTTITITSGSLQQVVDPANVEGGVYTLSWTGTAQGRVYTNNGGSVTAYAASPITVAGQIQGENVIAEFGPGTLGKVQVEPGSAASPFERRINELLICQKYAWTTYPTGVAPGTASTSNGARYGIAATAQDTGDAGTVRFPVTMAATPTIFAYNPISGAASTFYDYTAVGANGSLSTRTVTNSGLSYFNTSNSWTVGHIVGVHLFVSADF